MRGLNKFLKNKNTVTILGIIVILLLLYIGYTTTIKQTVNPVKVPVAKEKILPSKEITSDMLEYKNVSKIAVDDNVITNVWNIVGMYTNVNVTIPKGSMFYKEWLVEKDKLPGNWLEQVDFSTGEEAYYFQVSTATTFGNSILPDSYIDIYMKAYDDNEHVIYGKMLKNIKVLAVHDSNGKNVFDDSENIGTSSYLVFALSHDYYNLLMRAEYLEDASLASLVIAPQGTNSTSTEGALVSSATLRDYVNKRTSSVTDDQIKSTVENNQNQTNKANNKTTNR